MSRGDAARREDEWGNGDERNNLGEVEGMGGEKGGGAGLSHEGNDEVESAEFVSIFGVVEVERDVNGNTFSTNLT